MNVFWHCESSHIMIDKTTFTRGDTSSRLLICRWLVRVLRKNSLQADLIKFYLLFIRFITSIHYTCSTFELGLNNSSRGIGAFSIGTFLLLSSCWRFQNNISIGGCVFNAV